MQTLPNLFHISKHVVGVACNLVSFGQNILPTTLAFTQVILNLYPLSDKVIAPAQWGCLWLLFKILWSGTFIYHILEMLQLGYCNR